EVHELLERLLVALINNPLALIAATTPLILNHMKEQSARLDAEAAHRASELKEANEIADNISGNMDKLAYFSKEAMFAVIFRGVSSEQDQALWKSYHDALTAWESNKTTACAQTEMYFGVANARRLEKIQSDFVTLKNQINAAYYKRKTSKWFIEDKQGSKNDFRIKFIPLWNKLTDKMTDHSRNMIRQLQDEEVGSLKPANKDD
ncbi:MAG TPA: hypothetical protein VGC64_08260, partial [Pyrinomonadaceae bacterium]